MPPITCVRARLIICVKVRSEGQKQNACNSAEREKETWYRCGIQSCDELSKEVTFNKTDDLA
eukprot:1201056-Pleurochrysis_carterae.AAC.2